MANDVIPEQRREPPEIGLVLKAAVEAARDVFSPPLRRVLWRSLGLTLLLLLAIGTGLAQLIRWLSEQWVWLANYPLVGTLAVVLAGVGVFVGLVFLIPPVSAIVASYFLDDVAEIVERRCDPYGTPGKAMPVGQALLAGLRFAAISAGVNLLALMLLLVPVVNLFAFLGANAYLFGREYFELAATRYLPVAEAKELRRRHSGTVLLGGLVTALVVMVPVVNLVTPLFGAALMVRIHKAVARGTAARG